MSATHASPDDHHKPGRCEIRLKGHLDSRWAAWFDGLSLINVNDGTTIICGPVADGMAMMISPTVGLRRFRRRTTETAWRPEPRTGMPMIRACCFSGSSSRKPLTSYRVQPSE